MKQLGRRLWKSLRETGPTPKQIQHEPMNKLPHLRFHLKMPWAHKYVLPNTERRITIFLVAEADARKKRGKAIEIGRRLTHSDQTAPIPWRG